MKKCCATCKHLRVGITKKGVKPYCTEGKETFIERTKLDWKKDSDINKKGFNCMEHIFFK